MTTVSSTVLLQGESISAELYTDALIPKLHDKKPQSHHRKPLTFKWALTLLKLHFMLMGGDFVQKRILYRRKIIIMHSKCFLSQLKSTFSRMGVLKSVHIYIAFELRTADGKKTITITKRSQNDYISYTYFTFKKLPS